MKIIIEKPELLQLRVQAFIGVAEKVLKERRDSLWASFQIVSGNLRRVSLATSKKRFKLQSIDRCQGVWDCLNKGNFTDGANFEGIDWIDLRDVLYHTCYTINMQGEKSMKALRESGKDIVIEIYKDDVTFNKALETFQLQSIFPEK